MKKEIGYLCNKCFSTLTFRLVLAFARYYSTDEASNLTVIACPTGHMFLRLDVVCSAQ